MGSTFLALGGGTKDLSEGCCRGEADCSLTQKGLLAEEGQRSPHFAM